MINEMEMQGSNGHSANLVFAFLTGASVGIAAGLLLAPRPGKESREQLRDYLQKTGKRIQSAAQKSAGIAREAASRLRETVSDAGKELASSAAEGNRQPGFRKS